MWMPRSPDRKHDVPQLRRQLTADGSFFDAPLVMTFASPSSSQDKLPTLLQDDSRCMKIPQGGVHVGDSDVEEDRSAVGVETGGGRGEFSIGHSSGCSVHSADSTSSTGEREDSRRLRKT